MEETASGACLLEGPLDKNDLVRNCQDHYDKQKVQVCHGRP